MYLKRQGQKYVAMHSIPKALRPYFQNRPRFKRTTGETDLNRAKAVAAGFAVDWYASLAGARTALESGQPHNMVSWSQDGRPYSIDWLTDFTEDAEAPPPPAGNAPASGDVPLKDHIDAWIETLRADQPKTKHMKRTDAEAFAQRFKTAGGVRKKDIQTWVNGQLSAGVAVATIRRKLSNIRGLWGYLTSLEIVAEENQPFDKLILPANKATAVEIQPFSPAQVVDLVKRALSRGDAELADLIVVGAYSGGRIEELVTLECHHVINDDIVLPGTKTDAAPRRLPIHKELAPLLTRLIADRKKGYLFPDLTTNKFGDRSNAIGKRFGRLKTKAGFGEDYVFHSVRHGWTSNLWSAGVQRELISQMQGHATGTITLDVYSRDPARPAKLAAIELLSYPGLPELMKPAAMAA